MRSLSHAVRSVNFALFAAAIIFSSLANAAIIHVPHDFQSIQSAIDSAQSGDEVWVNSGTYAESITLRSGVGVYGGFAGDEASHDDRALPLNMSVLDGSNIGGKQAQHVVTMDDVTSVTLDGFVVKGGRATEDSTITNYNMDYYYMGMRTINRAVGGGIYSSGTLTSVIRNCRITQNSCEARESKDGWGGGIFACSSRIAIDQCEVTRNLKPLDYGAIALINSTATLASCTLLNHEGKALFAFFSSAHMEDTTVTQNNSGAIFMYGRVTVDRCRFIGNHSIALQGADSVTHSLFMGNGLAGDAVKVSNCVFVHNSIPYSRNSFDNCTILGSGIGKEYRDKWGSHIESGGLFRNTILVDVSVTDATFQNCIVQDSRLKEAPSKNTVFLGNLSNSGGLFPSYLFFQNCLLFQNDSLGKELHTIDCLFTDPKFVPARRGHWTALPEYDAATTQTIFTDANSTFEPNELSGRIIKVNSAQKTTSCYIVSNTAHTVTVFGKAEQMAAPGDEWMIMDYHAADGSSPCIDAGMTIPELTSDFEGRTRPQLGAYDIGIYEYGVEGSDGPADLAVESMWWNTPVYESPDIIIGSNIRNWGSCNSNFCIYTVKVDGVVVRNDAQFPIAANGGVSTHRDIHLGDLPAGKHQVTIIADPDKIIKDGDRKNNTLTKEIDVNPSADLQIVSMKIVPFPVRLDEPVTITLTVHNASNWKVPQANISLTSPEVHWPPRYQTVALAPDETKAVELTWDKLWPFYYIVTANISAQPPIHEKNSVDNSKVFKIIIGKNAKASDSWALY